MRALINRLLCVFLLCIANFSNAANLAPGSMLFPGQGIYSDNGQYLLILQGDGNLVYYRTSDWGVRWASYTNGRGGHAATMQGDGNFVVYNNAWAPLWHASTHNYPGAYLAAQDDGNLVIYWHGLALWNIGVDPKTNVPEPRFQGDVVGRNLATPFLGPAGHVGFFDGMNVYEVLNEGGNVVKYNTLSNFKSRVPSGYWGGGSPRIPEYYVNGCFNDYCGGTNNQTVNARWGMVLRANQIRILGATYTISALPASALPRTNSRSARPGNYRCDTYVLDIYDGTYANIVDSNGYILNVAAMPSNSPLRRWIDFTSGYLKLGIIPVNIFNKLKAYAG